MFHFIDFLIITAIFVLLFILQMLLSRQPAKWPGLLLPIFSFVVSLGLFGVKFWAAVQLPFTLQGYLAPFVSFLLANIPTSVFLGVYFIFKLISDSRKIVVDKSQK